MACTRIAILLGIVLMALAVTSCVAESIPTDTPSPPTNTPSLPPTSTSTPTLTPFPTSTATPTSTPTLTLTPTPSPTSTPTDTPTVTPTFTPARPADVRLISDLYISNLKPLVGEAITATFKVYNYGGQTFTAWRFGVKGRGPDDSIQDFYMIPDFSLAPGTGYTYFHSRSFSMPGKYWFTPHYSPDGVNWRDIIWSDGRRSVVEITVDGPPAVEAVYLQPSNILQGDAFVIRVVATDDFGVQAIEWWSENTGDRYLDSGQDAPCGGVTRCDHSWPPLKWTGKDGKFTIHARAYDIAGQSSDEASAEIIVSARFSLSIGGEAFASESVQNAIGFGINWVELRRKVGEVVLVDFLSGDTLPGPSGMAYRPDSARELLAGAGYPNGFDAVLLFDPEDELAAKLADLVAGYLSVVGIRPQYLWTAPADARTRFSTLIAAGENGLLIERQR